PHLLFLIQSFSEEFHHVFFAILLSSHWVFVAFRAVLSSGVGSRFAVSSLRRQHRRRLGLARRSDEDGRNQAIQGWPAPLRHRRHPRRAKSRGGRRGRGVREVLFAAGIQPARQSADRQNVQRSHHPFDRRQGNARCRLLQRRRVRDRRRQDE